MDDMKHQILSKVLEDLIEDLENGDGEKLRPKAALSVTAIKPEGESEMDPHSGPDMDQMASNGEDDDDLKALLEHYMSK